MTTILSPHSIGTPVSRADGRVKVTGTARYAYEHPVENPSYLHPIQSTIARGRVTRMGTGAAETLDGVIAVLTPDNAPPLADTSDGELAILQGDTVAFRGQFLGAVIAETPEIARHAQSLVYVEYETAPYDTELRLDHEHAYAPEQVNGGFQTDTCQGDVDTALGEVTVMVDQVYKTPMEHNNPMEPHACIAVWDDESEPRLTLFDSTQGAHSARGVLAPIFGLEPEQVKVIAPYVGGGFGSKGRPHAHNVLAAMAARLVAARPVKFALTRQQMFSLVGYRTPTIQHLRFGAVDDGLLHVVSHDAVSQTARFTEFAEQTAVPSRTMYAGSNRRTRHRVVQLDVPVPYWMRAPGECPGMFAVEVAMDELAEQCGLDPIDARLRNEPDVEPESGKPWSSRHLAETLRQGADRFGWDRRRAAGTRREGDWHVGLGVASSAYPGLSMPGSKAMIEYTRDGRYAVRIGAIDIGTGTWTALAQIAADALECPLEAVSLDIGHTDVPQATVEGGSSGLTSWGSTVVAAARRFREIHGTQPEAGATAEGEMPQVPGSANYAVHSFGAIFTEVRVHVASGEIRVPRMLGVFSVGRVINPKTARSQFLGGMTMGLGMALHEVSVLDHNTGHVVNHDFAEYHIPTNADVGDMEATWLDEEDPHANPMGSRGLGEIGIVGSPAAVANGYYNATGIRARKLPITPDVFFTAAT